MMEKDFDFDKIGKQMPYTTPEGFFEDVQQRITQRINDRKKKRRVRLMVISMIAAAAMVIGLIMLPAGKTVIAPPTDQVMAYQAKAKDTSKVSTEAEQTVTKPLAASDIDNSDTSANVETKHPSATASRKAVSKKAAANDDKWIENLSDEDLESLSSLSDNDVFMSSLD